MIFFARYEAADFGSPYIETEHLLLGIVREAPRVLIDLAPGIAPEFGAKWRAQFQHLKHTPKGSVSVDLPLSNESKRVLAYAAEEAERLMDRHIGAEHLVLGLLRERHGACAMLESVGINLEEARNHFGRNSYAPGRTPTESAEGLLGAGAGSSGRATGVPFIQFVQAATGEHIGVLPMTAIAHLPREGDVVQFEAGENERRCFKVIDVRYVFERTENRWPYRDHELTKIVVSVQRVEDTPE